MSTRSNTQSPRRSAARRGRGVSLIEVLVAVGVLSIGMVGVAGLHMTSKRANFEAVQRTTAAALLQDIVERMRANPRELATYSNAGGGRTLSGASMAAVDCSAACTANELARHDLYQWEQALVGDTEVESGNNVGGLTLPTACIQGPDGGSGIYTVAIAWRGLTPLANPVSSACGQGSGRYDDGADGDVYRRVILVDTFIVDPI